MSTTPAIVWQQILAVSGEDVDGVLWSNPQLEPGAPAGITLAAGQQLRCEVLTLGSTSVAYPFTVLVNAGSDDFQVTSGITPLKVGMLVAGSDALPVGLQILAVNEPAAGSVLLGGGSVFV
jgi:hypothetical protein